MCFGSYAGMGLGGRELYYGWSFTDWPFPFQYSLRLASPMMEMIPRLTGEIISFDHWILSGDRGNQNHLIYD